MKSPSLMTAAGTHAPAPLLRLAAARQRCGMQRPVDKYLTRART
ncbi:MULTISPECIES: hypothetical protein [Burkholderia]|nr:MULTISPECIES: hypothetical protein [Burkholderia]